MGLKSFFSAMMKLHGQIEQSPKIEETRKKTEINIFAKKKQSF